MKPTEEITITFEENDIKSFGHTMFSSEEGHLQVLFSPEDSMGRLIFKKLMKALGYKILLEEDFVWDSGNCDLLIQTDYSWDKYRNL